MQCVQRLDLVIGMEPDNSILRGWLLGGAARVLQAFGRGEEALIHRFLGDSNEHLEAPFQVWCVQEWDQRLDLEGHQI